MYNAAKSRAKKYGHEFDINKSDIVIPEVCPILGIKLEQSHLMGGTDNSPTLDRIDNTKGYTKGNVKVISKAANSCKRNFNVQQIESLLKYMKEII